MFLDMRIIGEKGGKSVIYCTYELRASTERMPSKMTTSKRAQMNGKLAESKNRQENRKDGHHNQDQPYHNTNSPFTHLRRYMVSFHPGEAYTIGNPRYTCAPSTPAS